MVSAAALAPVSYTHLDVYKRQEVTEDDTVPLTVTGVLQDGRVLSEEEATVTYSVEPGSGYALIQGSSLLAYDAGTVEVTAHMTYLDQTVDSEALTFTTVSYTHLDVYKRQGLDFGTEQPLKLRLRGANGNPWAGNKANAKVRFWYGEGENDYVDTVLRKTCLLYTSRCV